MTKDYLETEKFLTSSEKFCINLGLERVLKVLELFGNPQDKINVIHVAGTNGKGSVCTMIAEILKTAGFKTALYTSPHLFSYTERFKINGQNIPENIFSEYVTLVEQIAKKHNIELTEFEILTVAAYKYFYDEKVDYAVMETGMGGRLDATNTVKKPVAALITSISIDHKDRLGDTIEKIAFEKAGIIKPFAPVFVNFDNWGKTVVENVAKDRNSSIFQNDKRIDIKFENGVNYAVFDGEDWEFSLWGLHQIQNLSLVLKFVEFMVKNGVKISKEHIKSALKTVFIPARFQYVKDYNLIIDGSHNADAATVLRKNLDFYFNGQKSCWFYGTLSTKEYEKVVNILFRSGDTVYPIKFKHQKSVNEDEILQKINNKNEISFKKYSKTENILNYFSKEQLNILTGSFYMIGNIIPEGVIKIFKK